MNWLTESACREFCHQMNQASTERSLFAPILDLEELSGLIELLISSLFFQHDEGERGPQWAAMLDQFLAILRVKYPTVADCYARLAKQVTSTKADFQRLPSIGEYLPIDSK
jgi:hypothetical protein